jgi:hypothetical protein
MLAPVDLDLSPKLTSLPAQIAKFKAKHYRVVANPDPSALPHPLTGKVIDMVAYGRARTVVVLVRDQDGLRVNGCQDMRAIAQGVRDLGWEMELIKV